MPSPTLSVAMSVYNGDRFLAIAIESVLNQTFRDFEFLILDDGSSDRSAEIIRHYAKADARIRPIIRENRGLISSLNEMIELAQAPIIARMDADDICQPDRFAKQIAFLAAHPDYGVVGSWSDDIDENGNELVRFGNTHPQTHEDLLAAIEAGGPLICHPAVMYRRNIVQSVGGYHAAFRHCEDLDLWLRLSSVTRLGNIPESLLRYRRYPEQVSSRHVTELQIGTAVAQAAWRERKEGRPDPTATLEQLPPIAELDALFNQAGIASKVRQKVALNLIYSDVAMRGHGFDILLQHLREGGERDGMWRTVLRLMRFREPILALRLALTLSTSATA